jgi:hypothetical protein
MPVGLISSEIRFSLGHDRFQWQSLLNRIMNLFSSIKNGFLKYLDDIIFSRTTLLHGFVFEEIYGA